MSRADTAAALVPPTKDEVRAKARELGIDLIGFCRFTDLEALAPDYDRPSQISTYLTTLVVLGRRYGQAVARASDQALRQYSTGRTARHLEESAAALAYWLEERDRMAALVSATIPDLRRQPLGYAGPGGQGSLLLRRAAVLAGLGSLGLNEMLLTTRFGPRLFLAGVVTDLEVAPDGPFATELCPGLAACGKCAAVCPERAIPLEAPAHAPLASVRGLDAAACARATQPHGPDRMVEHIKAILTSRSGEQAAERAASPLTQRLWFDMTVQRQGAFTGCQRCQLVCPVGEDAAATADPR